MRTDSLDEIGDRGLKWLAIGLVSGFILQVLMLIAVMWRLGW